MAEQMNSNDHDLLIKIDTKLERVISDVSDLKTNLSGDVEKLKTDHVKRDEFESLLNWRYYLGGAIAILIALVTFFIIPEYKSAVENTRNIETRLQTVEFKLNNQK